MSDDGQNLTPARPVGPRRRLPGNPRMAQPINDDELEPKAGLEDEPAADQQAAIEAEAEPATDLVPAKEVAPATKAAPATKGAPRRSGPVQMIVDDVIEPPVKAAVEPAAEPAASPADRPDFDFPKTINETLSHVDQAWSAFRAAVQRFPSERMDERLTEKGWTRKQMLAHVAAWHDLTADRLVALINTGHVAPFEQDTDSFNANVARRAVGKTLGEILKDMDGTFTRLRRQMARLTDAQLAEDDWYAAFVIGGNTYGHYDEHWPDVQAARASGARPRR
jgi:hypothetical protein